MSWVERYIQKPEHLRGFQRERLVLQLTCAISEAMQQTEVSKRELARRMDVSLSFVTRMLDGNSNAPVQVFADALTVLGYGLTVALEPLKIGDNPVAAEIYEAACTANPED